MRTFHPESTIVISPHVRSRGTTTVFVKSPSARYRFSGDSARVLTAALPFLRQCVTLAELELQTSVPVDSLSAVLRAFTNDDLVDVTDTVSASDSGRFMADYFRLCDAWALDVFEGPFWSNMFAGKCTRLQVLGWGIEFYHRTLGADEHNDLSVKYCVEDADIHAWLTEHFSEEYGHGSMFLHGLRACGLSEADVLGSEPLQTTGDLIAYFNQLAATDTVAYLGCYGIMHSPRVGQTAKRVDEQFAVLAELYPYACGLMEAIRQHASLDLDLGHDSIVLEKLAARETEFTRDESIRILNAAWGVPGAFSRYFNGIYHYYGQPEAKLIRPRSTPAVARVSGD